MSPPRQSAAHAARRPSIEPAGLLAGSLGCWIVGRRVGTCRSAQVGGLFGRLLRAHSDSQPIAKAASMTSARNARVFFTSTSPSVVRVGTRPVGPPILERVRLSCRVQINSLSGELSPRGRRPGRVEPGERARKLDIGTAIAYANRKGPSWNSSTRPALCGNKPIQKRVLFLRSPWTKVDAL